MSYQAPSGTCRGGRRGRRELFREVVMEAAGQSWKKRANIVGRVYITQTGRYLKVIGGGARQSRPGAECGHRPGPLSPAGRMWTFGVGGSLIVSQTAPDEKQGLMSLVQMWPRCPNASEVVGGRAEQRRWRDHRQARSLLPRPFPRTPTAVGPERAPSGPTGHILRHSPVPGRVHSPLPTVPRRLLAPHVLYVAPRSTSGL